MRRLIPAAVILILTVAVCIYGHFYIEKACKSTLMDIDDFRNQKISAEELESRWHDREKNMAVFLILYLCLMFVIVPGAPFRLDFRAVLPPPVGFLFKE